MKDGCGEYHHAEADDGVADVLLLFGCQFHFVFWACFEEVVVLEGSRKVYV